MVSVVIPVYNEEESVPRLAEALRQELPKLGVPWEVILVNDGSADGTAAALDTLAQADDRFVAIHLRRNFGQTAAMAAGFDYARGDIIVAMDADLQNDPADIPKLLAKLAEGYDVVSGWRRHRKDRWLTRVVPSKIANWLISAITGVRLHDYGCSLKAYRRDIIRDVRLYGEMHRFLPALCHWAGARIAEVEVAHHPRRFGRSKYGLGRITRVLLDLITVKFLLSYSTMPIRVFGPPGLLLFLGGFGLGAYLSYQKLVFGLPLASRPALLLAVLLMVVGLQSLSLGLLGELIARTYYESQGKKTYTIRYITALRRQPVSDVENGQT
ncbi:MAG: glycosyltransferase family 2 protein [Armatimonadetes bacterium]|nr:glycosyltransferase family 2 protein [Armatimonadota bacterium]